MRPVASIEQRVLSWRKSSMCANGDCVEVTSWRNRVLVRNSAVPGVILEVSRSDWQAFLSDVAPSAHQDLATRRVIKAEHSPAG